jgi:hypothetical protein
MTRTYLTALLALSALVMPTSMLFAQGTADHGRVLRGRAETCQARSGGSRMRSSGCENEPQTVRTEIRPIVKAEAPTPRGPQCDASALTEYSQRGAMANVVGRISIGNCPAGTTGVYTLVARVKDESGEVKPIEFEKTWQHDTTQDVTFTGDYPIGEAVELMSVRVRSLKCTCAETAAETATAAAETPTQEAVPPR